MFVIHRPRKHRSLHLSNLVRPPMTGTDAAAFTPDLLALGLDLLFCRQVAIRRVTRFWPLTGLLYDPGGFPFA